MPYASSMDGTAMPPIRVRGALIATGSLIPVRAKINPSERSTASGLRKGRLRRMSSRRRRETSGLGTWVIVSSTAKPVGCKISNWASNIGAISAASPRAYAAIGSPRLPALT